MFDFTNYGEAHLHFLASHPASDGWRIYHFEEHHYFLRHALTFLLEKHPRAVSARSEYIIKPSERVLDDLIRSPYSPLVSPCDEDRMLEGAWYGLIEATWGMDKPLHIASISSFRSYGRVSAFIVGVKANSTLQSFLISLREYVRQQRDSRRNVVVVNGDDFPRPSQVTWDDLVLPDGLADSIRRDIDVFFASRDKYEALRAPYRRGLILAGQPGTGKTSTLRIIMGLTPAAVVVINPDPEFTEHHMGYAFQLAADHAPSLLIIEDLDHCLYQKHLSHFLNLVDGLRPQAYGVLLLATVNKAEDLDPALRHRPSRFDRIYRYSLPGIKERLAYLKKKGGNAFSVGTLEELARATKGFSPAYLQELVMTALLLAAHEGREPSDDDLRLAFTTLKAQFKIADEATEDIGENGDPVGFLSAGQDTL